MSKFIDDINRIPPKPKKNEYDLADLVLKIDKETEITTIGSLFINDKFFCYTLEDVNRDWNHDGDIDDPGEEKVYGETAIPRGTYKVTLNMSHRFKRLLPLLHNVKGFEGVRIHRGNWAKNTLGCILVGYQRGDDFIGTSKDAEIDLIEELKKYKEIQITLM